MGIIVVTVVAFHGWCCRVAGQRGEKVAVRGKEQASPVKGKGQASGICTSSCASTMSPVALVGDLVRGGSRAGARTIITSKNTDKFP